jgi:hypothetical protein
MIGDQVERFMRDGTRRILAGRGYHLMHEIRFTALVFVLQEGHGCRVFKNKVLREMFETK